MLWRTKSANVICHHKPSLLVPNFYFSLIFGCILVVYGDLDFRLVKKKKQMDIYFIDKPEAESQSKIPSQIKNKEMGIGPLGCH